MIEKNNNYIPQKIELNYNVDENIILEAVKKEKEIMKEVNEMWNWTNQKVLPRLILRWQKEKL